MFAFVIGKRRRGQLMDISHTAPTFDQSIGVKEGKEFNALPSKEFAEKPPLFGDIFLGLRRQLRGVSDWGGWGGPVSLFWVVVDHGHRDERGG